METRHNLLGLELPELERVIESIGEKKFRARQIYRWIYQRRAESFSSLTDLPVSLRRRLERHFTLRRPAVSRIQRSEDGTRKYLLSAPSGGDVESVFLPEPDRVTFCISPQIGCALDCHFCLTARLGLVRHLDPGEIVGQVLALLDDNRSRIGGRRVNIVMMGMGEPLHNYESSIAAVRLLADPDGVGIPTRRQTLSTAGLAPGILKLAEEPVRPRLAISLNATTDEVRSRIMPINRKYPLDVLLRACRSYSRSSRQRLTFEYVLLDGINNTRTDPKRLVSLVNRYELRAKVNLIPFNAAPGLHFKEPTAQTAEWFRSELVARGLPASVRRNRGRDISAACGLLALVPSGGSGPSA